VGDAVAAAARSCLRPGGWLVLETAAGSTSAVADALATLGYGHVGTTADLNGIDRVVEGLWP
jgi:methylase of polypeptide subunit release factors